MDDTIENIVAREILDSRGNPTLEVTVITKGGARGTYSVPSGASTGVHEAVERRDGGERYGGLGVQTTIELINSTLTPALIGMSAGEQRALDDKIRAIDGTENKSRLGANALVGISIAAAKAAAAARNQEPFHYLRTLREIKPVREQPYLFINLINGGRHSESLISFQEFHIVPMMDSVSEAMEAAQHIQRALKARLKIQFGGSSVNVGDEGGFVPMSHSHHEILSVINDSIVASGLSRSVKLSLDIAATELYQHEQYLIESQLFSSYEMLFLYQSLLKDFPILSIEDPFEQEDFDSFAQLLATGTVSVVGDDLTVTNVNRLKTAIEKKSIDSIIIKPNQIGTLSETLDTMKLATDNGIKCIVSHRSGETNDDFIADLAYAFGVYGFKSGALQRGERVAKYNRLNTIISMKQ